MSIDNARAYLGRGWSVIPARGKVPSIRWTEYQQRRPTEDEVTKWWKMWPDSNVFVITGKISGLFVLDVDHKAGGEDTLFSLTQKYGALPMTPIVLTGGGGVHYYFKHPGGDVRPSAGLLGNGLDIRADSAGVVAPYSIHPSGGQYTWEASAGVDDVPLADVPGWLMTLLGLAIREKLRPDEVLAGVPEGRRDVSLFRLAALYRAQNRPQAEAERLILVAAGACSPPFGATDALLKVARAYKLYDAGTAVWIPREAKPAEIIPNNMPVIVYTNNDDGNVNRLIDRHGDDLLYCRLWKKWLVWTDGHWQIDALENVQDFATLTARSIYNAAAAETDTEAAKVLSKWAGQSLNIGHWSAMISMAEHRVPVRPDVLDTNAWLSNTPTGTIDLHEGVLCEHKREDRITKRIPVAYDPLAEAPMWLAFLESIFDGDAELISYAQRAVGYSMTGITTEQCMFILHGSGANGKGTFVDTIAAVLGDYGLRIPTQTLMYRREAGIPNDIAALKGVRFAYASESEEGQRLAEAFIKDITGEDMISARFLNSEFFNFRPELKLWFSTNHRPDIRGTDEAIWRRIRLIPFKRQFAGDAMDRNLREKLRSEMPGILNWMIEGCMQWQILGLGNPPAVQEATAEYRGEMDTLSVFLETMCVIEPSATVLKSHLAAAYHSWRATNGERPESTIKLNAKLKERGFTEYQQRVAGRTWNGIALLADILP